MPDQLTLFSTPQGLRTAPADRPPDQAREPTLAEVRAWLFERGYGVKRNKRLDPLPPTNGTATSAAAARSMEPRAGTLRALVLGHIRDAGEEGLTCDQVEQRMQGRHQTVSARVYELARQGHITQSGRVRTTRSGRDAIVWVARGSDAE